MRYTVLCSTVRLRFIRDRRDRLYMRKIQRLNASRSTCWTDLVYWHYMQVNEAAARMRPLTSIVGSAGPCETTAALCGVCYCGKFATQAAADQCRAERNPEYDSFVVAEL